MTLPLDRKALKALEKLERLAAEKKAELTISQGIYHDKDFQKLSNVQNWVRFVRENHENGYARSGVLGCLDNLRHVARTFKFKLKDEE